MIDLEWPYGRYSVWTQSVSFCIPHSNQSPNGHHQTSALDILASYCVAGLTWSSKPSICVAFVYSGHGRSHCSIMTIGLVSMSDGSLRSIQDEHERTKCCRWSHLALRLHDDCDHYHHVALKSFEYKHNYGLPRSWRIMQVDKDSRSRLVFKVVVTTVLDVGGGGGAKICAFEFSRCQLTCFYVHILILDYLHIRPIKLHY